MIQSIKIKKWEYNNIYFARIIFFNSNNQLEYIIKSDSKNEFNQKISILIKNNIVMKN